LLYVQEFFVRGANRPLGNREGRTKSAGNFPQMHEPECRQCVESFCGAFTPKNRRIAEKSAAMGKKPVAASFFRQKEEKI
jgi:hypothetical protein